MEFHADVNAEEEHVHDDVDTQGDPEEHLFVQLLLDVPQNHDADEEAGDGPEDMGHVRSLALIIREVASVQRRAYVDCGCNTTQQLYIHGSSVNLY